MARHGTNLAEPIPTLARTNATGAAGCRPRESRIMRDTLIKTDSPMDRLRSRRTVAMKSTATALSSAEQEDTELPCPKHQSDCGIAEDVLFRVDLGIRETKGCEV